MAENITLKIRGPEKICIVGPNGAGKTTLLKKIATELKAREDLRVDYMPQNYEDQLDLSMTPVDFLDSTGEKSERTKIRTYLGSLKYTADEMDHPIRELSGGQKAKVLLLKMSLGNANVLILDEPTVGLDVIARDEVLNMLREYMEENESSSILISSHISSDLESLCDDFYMIHAGKIILHEDTDVLLSDYAVLKVSEEEYEKLDQQYLIKIRKEAYGYRCLTNQKQFYMENYPDVVIENGKIDDLVVMMEEQA